MNHSDHEEKEAGLAAAYPESPHGNAYPAANTADRDEDRMSYADTVVSDSNFKPMGVLKVEAAEAFWNHKTKWILFGSLLLAAYVYSLDGMTTYLYNAAAWSEFGLHSSLGRVQTANSIIIAVGKPFWAKLSDAYGRGEAFLGLAILYGVGYAVIAGAQGAGAMYAGQVIYTLGYTGLQILLQIIVADLTTLRWRALVNSILTVWFILNAFVAAEISARVTNWRWGYGMFAILMPATLLPVIISLLWAQWKGKKILKERGVQAVKEPPMARLKRALIEMDFVGLLLLGMSLALILLTFALVYKANGKWKNPSMIAMLVVGCILFPIFLAYEWKVPARPVFPMRWFRRLPIFGACLIGFLDFVSFYLQFTYLYSFASVTVDWAKPQHLTYFTYTQTLCLTFFGICAGAFMAWTRRFKWMITVGLCIRLLGCGLMLHARGPSGNMASLVMCQVLQGIGGGIAHTAMIVAAQASVSHIDVATVTAVVLLLTEVGNSVGSAAATGLWQEYMPGELATFVPTNNQTLLTELFGDMTSIVALPPGDPIKLGAITAYEHMMHRLVVGATVVAIFPIIVSIFMIKDIRLTDAQNAYDGKDLEGKPVEEADELYQIEKEEMAHRINRHSSATAA
ncbi:uncharacterized protein CcaverHIS019_0402650 [Cutaneotrichosporon cavernicola]|uniref:Major facilitator superfamily (MFS) profile domain-containing protein n=1 Tax=Cutaneotrichosporon cavernicola TaxID=279322 RepID=A0AA48L3U2_9TREE|nr:uncharacterized protein CcaverHIS019_0402650 [Cutaneotrichosporon cavernicola]BEI91445.1 hypothetical protein CcaverHIS019_0402650 [Cutaneotrichosporon cavernicola]